eukprot:8539672-Alexandrium_andersonii.AAC.1
MSHGACGFPYSHEQCRVAGVSGAVRACGLFSPVRGGAGERASPPAVGSLCGRVGFPTRGQ